MSAATSKKEMFRPSWDRIASHSVDNGLSLIHHNVITTPGSVQVVRGGGVEGGCGGGRSRGALAMVRV